jgi:hypothetical protein
VQASDLQVGVTDVISKLEPGTCSDLKALCDLVTLIYHEARNVRHLLRQQILFEHEWRFLVSLPTKREDAWRRLSAIRDEAYKQSSVDGIFNIYERHFHVSLSDLREMFGNDNWRHAKSYGGNAWAGIADFGIKLGQAIRQRDASETEHLLGELSKLKHNNGFLLDKLTDLENSCRK